jgi:Xaa-Pro aminopeptidase
VERLADTRARMRDACVDLLAVGPSDDLLYLLGFSPTADERACMLLLGADDLSFLVPSLNAEQSRAELPALPFFAWRDEEGPRAAMRAAAAPFGGARRTAVGATMRADFLLLLQATLDGSEYVSADGVVGEQRLRKDSDEIETLRASARTADAAIQAAFAACVAGARERDVAEAAAAALRRAGAEEVCHTSIASGPNSAFPHHHSGDRVLREGDAITIDVGGRLGGYASDITRLAHVGPPSERYEHLRNVVERAVQAALAAVRPGVPCSAVDAAARSTIAAAGFGPQFVHRTGHGLGLSTHEPPSIMAGEERELVPGMVFSIEPGVYFTDEVGLRLEEIVVVTDDGCRILSELPRDLHVS